MTIAQLERLQENEASRTKRLKAVTRTSHERIDNRIMAAAPFADKQRYSRFLTMQHAFHRDLDALFFDIRLDALLPDLAGRRRLALIERDFADLGLAVPQISKAPYFSKEQPIDLAEALGWLYVIEGSNLGAAFLLKDAAKLGLHEDFGARHLAGVPEGRGLHWRTFTKALDSIDLTGEQERSAVSGAEAAFRRVHQIAEEVFA
jgi:heme oxygenase (biliverdin-IX-beta and delta-forming)